MADGRIVIETGMDTKGIKEGASKIASDLRKATSEVESLSNATKNTIESQINAFERYGHTVEKQRTKVAGLKAELDKINNTQVPTEEYAEITAQIERETAEFNKLMAKQEEMQATGRDSGKAWDSLQYKMEEIGNSIRYAKAEAKELVASGGAYVSGVGSPESVKTAEKLKEEEQKLDDMNKKLATSYDTLKQKIDALNPKPVEDLEKATSKTQKSVDTKQISTSLQRTNKSMGSFSKGAGKALKALKGVAVALIGIRSAMALINKLKAYTMQGINNLVQYSPKLNESFSGLKSSLAELKNSLATAFEPILNTVIPILTKLIGYLNTGIEAITRFRAALQGKSTYTKAKKQAIDYAKSLNSVSDASKGALASFDKLNVLSKQSSGGGSGELTGADAFEEVAIDSKTLALVDQLKGKLEEIKEYYQTNFAPTVNKNLEKIKKSFKGIVDFQQHMLDDLEKLKFPPEFMENVNKLINANINLGGDIISGLMNTGTMINTDTWDGLVYPITVEVVDSSPELADMATRMTETLDGLFWHIKELGDMIWGDTARQDLTMWGTIISGVIDGIANGWRENGAPAIEEMQQFFSDLKDTVVYIWNDHFKPTLDDVYSSLTELWDEHLKPLWDKLVPLFNSVVEFTSVLGRRLMPVIRMISSLISAVLMPPIKLLIGITKSVLGLVFDVIRVISVNLTNTFTVLAKILEGDIPGAIEAGKKAVEDNIEQLKQFGKDFVNFFISIGNTMIEAVETMLNGFVKALNNIGVDLPNGTHIGVSIPEASLPRIPELANGAVIPANAPFLAMLGDQTNGTNIETPLSTMVQAFKQAISEMGGTGGDVHITCELDGKTLFEEVVKRNQMYSRRTGASAF